MIMVTEQAALKAQSQFEQIQGFIRQAVQDGLRIDTVERNLMRFLLSLGYSLLSSYVAQQGNGDVGPEVTTSEGCTARRLPERHDRRYVSIFGELTISRTVYGTREGQKIERVPLDEQLGLPEGDFSYVLEDWGQRLCLKESFAEAGHSLEMLLGLRLGTRALEQMNRTMAGYAPSFQDALETPPACEEGPLLVVTADGKGVPMRRPEEDGPKPHHRWVDSRKESRRDRLILLCGFRLRCRWLDLHRRVQLRYDVGCVPLPVTSAVPRHCHLTPVQRLLPPTRQHGCATPTSPRRSPHASKSRCPSDAG